MTTSAIGDSLNKPIALNDVCIPRIGFGVYQSAPEETAIAVETALNAGYRHIDTAAEYGNEREVGDSVATQVVDEVVANLGAALGGLVNLYNPERVIIGGWVGIRLMERSVR